MKKRILYVENEKPPFDVVCQYLKDGKVDVDIARAGGVKEFWDSYQTGVWDLILLDVKLPPSETVAREDYDAGIKIVETLVKQNNHTSVIVITSLWRSTSVLQGIEGVAFVKRVIYHPLDAADLVKAVKKALRTGRGRS